MTYQEQGECPICYDQLNDENYTLVCWNEHYLCNTCYKDCLKPRTAPDVISGMNVELNNGCPTCRDTMFVWEEVEEGKIPQHIK